MCLIELEISCSHFPACVFPHLQLITGGELEPSTPDAATTSQCWVLPTLFLSVVAMFVAHNMNACQWKEYCGT